MLVVGLVTASLVIPLYYSAAPFAVYAGLLDLPFCKIIWFSRSLDLITVYYSAASSRLPLLDLTWLAMVHVFQCNIWTPIVYLLYTWHGEIIRNYDFMGHSSTLKRRTEPTSSFPRVPITPQFKRNAPHLSTLNWNWYWSSTTTETPGSLTRSQKYLVLLRNAVGKEKKKQLINRIRYLPHGNLSSSKRFVFEIK